MMSSVMWKTTMRGATGTVGPVAITQRPAGMPSARTVTAWTQALPAAILQRQMITTAMMKTTTWGAIGTMGPVATTLWMAGMTSAQTANV